MDGVLLLIIQRNQIVEVSESLCKVLFEFYFLRLNRFLQNANFCTIIMDACINMKLTILIENESSWDNKNMINNHFISFLFLIFLLKLLTHINPFNHKYQTNITIPPQNIYFVSSLNYYQYMLISYQNSIHSYYLNSASYYLTLFRHFSYFKHSENWRFFLYWMITLEQFRLL